ncbi:4-alpha-glucanotransferase [Bowmanella sp. Y26]|uniref:4-alpha-glucanotransferase n=1 Tax=Bowmanella yangjiangensis TaxID=2811230 RepID=UPI001BDD64FA|nr:4-alpha-glucanotransferase [Bowmanella yangjiangensis]MBT1065244.1 4-alpha-glucanotransferase [Bowmanella yangjiangensis]
MNQSVIDRLLEIRGIESDYIDAWGNPAHIDAASKIKLLAAMGYPVDDDSALVDKLEQERQQVWWRALDPVQVNRVDEPLLFTLRLPIELVNDRYLLRLNCESGNVIDQPVVPSDGELINVGEVQDDEFQEYLLCFNSPLPPGYHQLSLLAEDEQTLAMMRWIVAPAACYTPPAIADGGKVWGLSVQLYCLRSENNWGVGDFSDLCQLLEKAAGQGAHFIGLNPIHALYPANPDACSPYSPSSRRWLNIIYLDVTAIEGFHEPGIQSICQQKLFQQQLSQARASEYVDYQLVTELKLAVLEPLFAQFQASDLASNSALAKGFYRFIEEGGESLKMLATYEALQAHFKAQGLPYWGWPVFPTAYSEFHKPKVQAFAKQHAEQVLFYQFLQWQAARQLEKAHQVAEKHAMCIGLYRDLAVGVSEGSAEIWGNQSLYATNASIGAPPDVLGPLGQNWGLPPMDPQQLYLQAYQPIIDLFAANMRSCGALRIDHVMALLRLWWVARGDSAKQGGYVYYPVDDLLGILALESQRNKVMVIGEDLGTVPDAIRSKLADNGIYSYRVFFFEQAQDGGFYSPAHYPVQSMSTLTTHDMPTLTGYWHCLDLELGQKLGLYPSEALLQGLFHARHDNKQRILDSLHGHGSIASSISGQVDEVGMSNALNQGMQLHMAKGSSALLSLQLEDWLEMDAPVNVPGTSDEYPNWRRKLSTTLEALFADPALKSLSQKLTEARQQAGQHSSR